MKNMWKIIGIVLCLAIILGLWTNENVGITNGDIIARIFITIPPFVFLLFTFSRKKKIKNIVSGNINPDIAVQKTIVTCDVIQAAEGKSQRINDKIGLASDDVHKASFVKIGKVEDFKEKFKNLLDFHNLNDFWNSLDKNEKHDFYNVCFNLFGVGIGSIPLLNIDESQGIYKSDGYSPSVSHVMPHDTLYNFLHSCVSWMARNHSNHMLTEKLLVLLEAQEEITAIKLHYIYLSQIESFYRLRDKQSDAIDKTIEYCIKDIELFPEFIEAYSEDIINSKDDEDVDEDEYAEHLMREKRLSLRVPSFERLAIIYENQRRYADAIQVCDLAINYGFESFANRKLKLEKFYNMTININGLDDLKDGFFFEEYIAELLNKIGYAAETTKKSGDFGVDVIAEKDGIKYAVQCKLFSKPVGPKAVQEVFTGMSFYDCSIAIVVTNNVFTNAAVELAQKTKVMLWDRKKLSALLDEIKGNDSE